MVSLTHVTLEVDDTAAAERFYSALGLDHVRVRAADAPTSGFRGFTLSLLVSQPGNADAVLDAALAAGATTLKPAAKSFWGYGGVVKAPDGTIWKVATSKKKDSTPAAARVDETALLLGVDDVKATKRFYEEHGLKVGKSFGGKYVEFDLGDSPVKLGLYGRASLAKDAGVPVDGSGSHRLVIGSDAGAFTDLDGFVWEPAD